MLKRLWSPLSKVTVSLGCCLVQALLGACGGRDSREALWEGFSELDVLEESGCASGLQGPLHIPAVLVSCPVLEFPCKMELTVGP